MPISIFDHGYDIEHTESCGSVIFGNTIITQLEGDYASPAADGTVTSPVKHEAAPTGRTRNSGHRL